MTPNIQLVLIAMLGFMCLAQFCYIIYQTHRNELERKDLYSRLMARDLYEYSACQDTDTKSRNTVRKGIEQSVVKIFGGD